VYSYPFSISGALYAGLPVLVIISVTSISPFGFFTMKFWETPKSMIFT